MKQGGMGSNLFPWSSIGKPLVVRSPEEITAMILGSEGVKEVMSSLVRERA